MKRITLSILALALCAGADARKLDRSVRPKPGPAPEIRIGSTESFTLPNGLKVFVVENHKLPVVSYSIQLDVRPALEGAMAGYREMMSELLTSGTATRSKEQLNEEIDLIGAQIHASDTRISGSSLKKHQERLLELLSDITMNARFTQEELDKVKKRMLSALSASRNEPDNMLRQATAVINFGKDHPYGEVATEETVEQITLDQCRAYYQTYFRPNVAYMAIVGDIKPEEARAVVEKYFGSWQRAEVPAAQYPTPAPPATTRVAFVPREAAVQSVINVTYPIDLQRNSPDVIPARVANAILGGGSYGRLFLSLREAHGWTYGSYSSLEANELVGSFTAYAKCRNNVSDSAVGEILAEMRRMQQEPVSEEALRNTISYLSGDFAIGLENPERVAQYAINIERYKLPKDYYQNYLKNLAGVTAADVQRVASKYIRPESANIIVVGNKNEVAEKLSVYDKDGVVTFYDHYGREIADGKGKTLPEGLTAADVMKKYAEALGGEKVLSGIKDIRTESEGEIQGIRIGILELKKSPDKLKVQISQMGMVAQRKVLNGSKGFQEGGGQRMDLDEEDIADSKESADMLFPVHPEKYGVKRTLTGIEAVNGNDAYIVSAVNLNGSEITEYYDVATGLLVKKVSHLETPQGPMSVAVEYSDYREVPGTKGYKIPYATSIPIGPGMSLVTKVKNVEVNKGIPDSEFK